MHATAEYGIAAHWKYKQGISRNDTKMEQRLAPGADIFAKYALRDSGITRNVLIDRDGKIVKLTRLYNEEEFTSLVQKIDEMLKK